MQPIINSLTRLYSFRVSYIISLFAVFILIARPASAQSDLAQPFVECDVKGSVTIYDYKQKLWILSDVNDSQRETLPASTFKIVNTLIALETGAVEDECAIIKWPGHADTQKYGNRPDIYRNMSMETAFKLSAGWAYRELAGKIGRDNYQYYLKELHYGNQNLSQKDTDFWNFGDFAISPINQVQILIGVYEETLPFSKHNFTILKKMMVVEETPQYILRGKTGWSRDGLNIGWWVGYLETEDNVYFFATRIEKGQVLQLKEFQNCRIKITEEFLKQVLCN